MRLCIGRVGIWPVLVGMKYCLIMIYFSFMFLWKSVVFITNKNGIKASSEALFTLEYPIRCISSYSSATAVWLILFQKVIIYLFLTMCLEVQNKLKMSTYTGGRCSAHVLLEIHCFGFIVLYKKGPNFEIDCLKCF